MTTSMINENPLYSSGTSTYYSDRSTALPVLSDAYKNLVAIERRDAVREYQEELAAKYLSSDGQMAYLIRRGDAVTVVDMSSPATHTVLFEVGVKSEIRTIPVVSAPTPPPPPTPKDRGGNDLTPGWYQDEEGRLYEFDGTSLIGGNLTNLKFVATLEFLG